MNGCHHADSFFKKKVIVAQKTTRTHLDQSQRSFSSCTNRRVFTRLNIWIECDTSSISKKSITDEYGKKWTDKNAEAKSHNDDTRLALHSAAGVIRCPTPMTTGLLCMPRIRLWMSKITLLHGSRWGHLQRQSKACRGEGDTGLITWLCLLAVFFL